MRVYSTAPAMPQWKSTSEYNKAKSKKRGGILAQSAVINISPSYILSRVCVYIRIHTFLRYTAGSLADTPPHLSALARLSTISIKTTAAIKNSIYRFFFYDSLFLSQC